jgi:dTDP-4-dehydrorhamnose reductase
MKIALFGADGQVGWELRRSLLPLGDVVPLVRDAAHNADGLCGDLADPAGVAATIDALVPTLVVNAAAYTAVDRAENEIDVAKRINADAPGVMAHAAAQCGALFVHYSTDYVFDGSGVAARSEDSATGPLNAYGVTKLAGEQAVLESGARSLIFRTSWVYALRGHNFAKTMLRLAADRDKLTVVDDQFGAPTGAELIADVTAHCVRQAMCNDRAGGIYHLAAAGETSWHGFARHVIARAIAVPSR